MSPKYCETLLEAKERNSLFKHMPVWEGLKATVHIQKHLRRMKGRVEINLYLSWQNTE